VAVITIGAAAFEVVRNRRRAQSAWFKIGLATVRVDFRPDRCCVSAGNEKRRRVPAAYESGCL
jgi:hypothetical protein